MDTLTSSDCHTVHTSNFLNIRHTQCAVATLEHSNPFQPVNYIRIVAFSPGSLKAFFYDETMSIRYSTTMKSSTLLVHIKESYPSLQVSIQ